MEALERQLATVLQQFAEAEDRRTTGEEAVRGELARASAGHEAGIEAVRHDLVEQDARRERLSSELAALVASLSVSRGGQSEQIAELRRLLGQGAGSEPPEPAASSGEGDELPRLQSSAIRALHAEVGRLSRRLDLDAEEAARTAAALMERIEDSRRAAGRSRDGAASTGGVRT